MDRNATGNSTGYYQELITTVYPNRTYSMFGNPNLGQVQAIFLGVENVSQAPKCTEVWFDELRLSNLNDQGGYAANGRVDIKIADLGTVYLSGKTQSVGFGSIDQSINERALSSTTHWMPPHNWNLENCFRKNLVCRFRFMAVYQKPRAPRNMIHTIWI